ncbi:hypothetical protein, partial [Candidatus Borrarchaeum sp.]|uniref:hypothetical protein n=1 Tax=Candidatus Borrarchaeum sp. TaxID=2846742 RepID=UPI00258061B3
TRVDPDDSNGGLPDLQISIQSFSVSGAKKDKGYNYGNGDDRQRATVSLHDFSYTIKVECESDRNILGDVESQYYWYDVDLSMRIRVDDDSWVGFEKISMSDVKDDSNQVDFGDVSKDKDFDYIDIGSGTKNPSDYGLKEHCTAVLRIKKADDNSGVNSYTATAKISGQIVIVTSEGNPEGGGGSDDSGGSDDYSDYVPTGDYGEYSEIISMLGLGIIVFVAIIGLMVVYAIFVRRR